jgi:hypothetical protein
VYILKFIFAFYNSIIRSSVSNTPEDDPTEGSKHVAVQHHTHIKDKC